MTFFELLLISIGLSMDCFAVSLSFGTSQTLKWRDILKTALFFGLFQGMMPIIGWLIGSGLQSYIAQFDHWIAFGILGFIGLKMIIQSFSVESAEKQVDIRRFPVLLSLSVATSIDALITGVSFGFIMVNILMASILIAVVTFINSVIGARLGQHSTFLPAKWAEFGGGTVLIAIGTKILLEHLNLI
jgi:putative Mn2+ efflux pump MntP